MLYCAVANSVRLPIVRPRRSRHPPSASSAQSISTFVFRYLPPDEINRPKTSMPEEEQTSQSPPAKCQAAAPSLSLSSDTCSSASIQDRACALFRDAEILAPMVRASTTPLRTLALSYGADLVYTQEIVDRSITTCDRVVNEELGTIDYVRKTGGVSAKALKRLKANGEIPVVLRIAPELERGRLIYQLGTGESNLALPAALQVQQDVDGLDVNMVRWAYKPSFVSYYGNFVRLYHQLTRLRLPLCGLTKLEHDRAAQRSSACRVGWEVLCSRICRARATLSKRCVPMLTCQSVPKLDF